MPQNTITPLFKMQTTTDRERAAFSRFPVLKKWTVDLRHRVTTIQEHLRITQHMAPGENPELWPVVEVCRVALHQCQGEMDAEFCKMPDSEGMKAFTLMLEGEYQVNEECRKLFRFPMLGRVLRRVYSLGQELDNETWNKWIEELKNQETAISPPSDFWEKDKLFNKAPSAEDGMSDADSMESGASSRKKGTTSMTAETSMLPQSTNPTAATATAASQQPTEAGTAPTTMSVANLAKYTIDFKER
jgi:hypothetical protein